ncbi:hypothetical protein [Aliivibrio fischeri]|uniref:hypothetical protein n=1 Tax=Aliivibrio fischeri TaxID=668 RepID=UPI001F36D619|nr:hypothetical protein [Aliivibrio fischeri]MCE7534925.1 hypothetical protein [Aliivibrio fischeri]MCE7559367.1 hypothetical protein [Aliivibrio fischeri]
MKIGITSWSVEDISIYSRDDNIEIIHYGIQDYGKPLNLSSSNLIRKIKMVALNYFENFDLKNNTDIENSVNYALYVINYFKSYGILDFYIPFFNKNEIRSNYDIEIVANIYKKIFINVDNVNVAIECTLSPNELCLLKHKICNDRFKILIDNYNIRKTGFSITEHLNLNRKIISEHFHIKSSLGKGVESTSIINDLENIRNEINEIKDYFNHGYFILETNYDVVSDFYFEKRTLENVCFL